MTKTETKAFTEALFGLLKLTRKFEDLTEITYEDNERGEFIHLIGESDGQPWRYRVNITGDSVQGAICDVVRRVL